MTARHRLPRLVAGGALATVLVAACGSAATPSPGGSPAAVTTASPGVATASAGPTAAPASTPSPTAAATPSPAPTASPTPAPTASPTPAATPRATAAGSATDAFWDRVERGIRDAGRVEVVIAGPAAAVLRFEAAASATVIDGVVGFVCVGGRAYDGQSAFTALPGRWTCGAPALVAGFRGIGQPIDAWNRTIPTDTRRAETTDVAADRWTWRYRATSPYYGGAVTASVTLDPATGRVVAASRRDPTGETRYTFRYGVDIPRIEIPD